MELNMFLSIILYVLGIILLVVLICLVLKSIQILDKLDKMIDDVQKKVDSLDGLFYVIDKTTNGIDLIGNKIVSTITTSISKMFKNKKKKEEEFDYE